MRFHTIPQRKPCREICLEIWNSFNGSKQRFINNLLVIFLFLRQILLFLKQTEISSIVNEAENSNKNSKESKSSKKTNLFVSVKEFAVSLDFLHLRFLFKILIIKFKYCHTTYIHLSRSGNNISLIDTSQRNTVELEGS